MNRLFFVIVVLMFPLLAFSQMDAKSILMQRGEVYFRFQIAPERLNEISRIVSIDGYRNGICYAYANAREFAEFRKLGIDCEPVREYYEAKDELQMAESLNDMFSWNVYPTYSIYFEMMQYFATTYPEICKLDTIGTSYSGYKLLAVKISDNVNADEAEPEFFLGGQMHGDELIGGMVCLRLIHKLLSEYGTNSEVANLVNNMEIFINPLSNPEGTYFAGGSNMDYASRYTRIGDGYDDFIDINRNFPDAIDGEHPDGNVYSIETEAFMQYADEHNFVMSANLHSGAELVNYPFDTEEALPADDAWWQMVSSEYVALARQACNDPEYMTSDYSSGYTNGYAWYRITGSRQDYMNYFKHCREVTLELSIEKQLPNNLLPSYTSRNLPPMMAYMNRATKGLRGFVTDSLTGEPLRAMVFVNGHDYFNSHVYSFLPTGEYYRYLKAGHYNVSFYADGYIHKTIAVDIADGEALPLDVQLVQGYDPETIIDSNDEAISLYPNPVVDKLFIGSDKHFSSLEIYDVNGRLLLSKKNIVGFVDVSMLSHGQYLLNLVMDDGKVMRTKFMKM